MPISNDLFVYRVRDQWDNEERSKSFDQTRSVRQRPNPASNELESIQNLLGIVDRKIHKGKPKACLQDRQVPHGVIRDHKSSHHPCF